MLPQYGFRVVYYNIIRGFNNINVGENGGGSDYNKNATAGKAIVGQSVVGYVPSIVNVAVVGTSEVV